MQVVFLKPTNMAKKAKKRVVVIGGGTGTFTVLSGLKKYPLDLTAIVAMADNGGSTGILRDELGVLPPGDVRSCLVALSKQDNLMRTLMNYRFDNGKLEGLNFGNLLLSALEKVTGSFDAAIERASDILRTEGRVLPSTLDKVTLVAQVGDKTIRGEETIQQTTLNGDFKKIWLEPAGRANPKAVAALLEADAIVLGPGNFYASVIPNLLVEGIPAAIRESKAVKIFVCNLMTKAEHTHGFSVADYVRGIEEYLGGNVDVVIYNNATPDREHMNRYARVGDTLTSWNELPENRTLVGKNLMSTRGHNPNKIGVAAKESSLVRHDPAKIASAITKLLGVKKR